MPWSHSVAVKWRRRNYSLGRYEIIVVLATIVYYSMSLYGSQRKKGYASQEILNVTVLFRLIFDWSMFRFMRDVSNLFHVNQANQMAIFREVIRVKRITIAIFIIYTN